MKSRPGSLFSGLLAAVLAGLLAACGESATSTPNATPAAGSAPGGQLAGPLLGPDGNITVVAPPATGANINGQIFWIKENNIWQGGAGTPGVPPVTVKSLGGKQLTKATPLALAKSPAISPDGSKMAYAYSPEPVGSAGNIVIGQDIYLYDLKTGTDSLLIQRDDPQTFLDNPVWSKDGQSIFFDSRVPRRDQNKVVVGETISINRFDLASRQREKYLEDAREPVPLPDGQRLIFVAVNASAGTYETSLKMLDLSAKQVTTLVSAEQGFAGVYMPRPAPDGQLIAFSGAGGPDLNFKPQPTPAPTKTSLKIPAMPLGLTALLGSVVNAPPAHGLPYDLWLVRPDGGGLKRLTTLFEDQPMPAWSPDGKKITFLAGLGFYTIDADGKNLVKLSDQGAHGGFDWRS